ncbi:MAG TPA: HEAT repeat domain-containing protein [Geothrix sp.]|nr:HEAT repeat domain-containing protein [Geothrix sp.]
MSDFLQLAQTLTLALKALQMYTANHPKSRESLAAALTALDRELTGKSSLQFVVTGDKAFVDGQVQDARNTHVATLVRLVSERAVSGFVFEPGITAEELTAFLTGLTTKPARLEEEGGFEMLLNKAGVERIRLSQVRYQEVREGAETPSEGGASTLSPAAPPASDSPEGLISFLREALLSNLGASERSPGTSPEADGDGLGFLRNLKPADLGGLGALGYDLGLGEEMPTPVQMGTLRQVLLGVDPDEQLRLLAGMASLPDRPAGLALGVKALAGEILASAIGTLTRKGHPWGRLRGPLQQLLRSLPQKREVLEAMATHLRDAGPDGQQMESLLRELEWEELSLEGQLLKILEEGHLFLLSLEQRLAFLRELLELRRHDEFLRILDQLIEALQSEFPDLRLKSAQTLFGVARWVQVPGLPLGGEGTLSEALHAHFAWEPDPPIHKWTAEALDALLTTTIQRGELGRSISELRELEGLCAFLDEQYPWRLEALERLRAVLFRPPLMDAALEQAFKLPRDGVVAEVYPYFEFLGDPMARHLVERLADESDRTRRGRIVECLRALNQVAIPPLMEALGSPTWYLVRNALTLLSDLGDAGSLPAIVPLLRHAEPRVRRTAVRTLWKLGGPEAEPHLLARMKDTDGGTLQEILFVLGQLKSENSLPAVMEMAQDKRVVESLRLQALDTLAHIASPKAIGVLQECLRRRSFFGGGESPEVRFAAAKALMALGTGEAEATLRKVVEADPRGEERESLRRILAAGRPS